MIKKLLSLALISLLFFVSTEKVYATVISAPDSVSQTVYAYGSLIEAGDLFILSHYNIDYGSNPVPTTATATDSFITAYKKSTGSFISTGQITTQVNYGYGEGAYGVYLSSAQVTSASITWGDSDFGTLLGNPSYFSGSLPSNDTSITWQSETGGGNTTLVADILSISATLEGLSYWSSCDLVDSGALATCGETYWGSIVPSLSAVSPSLYSGVIANPDFSERTFTNTYGDSLDTYWDGSSQVNAFDGLATYLFNYDPTGTSKIGLIYTRLLIMGIATVIVIAIMVKITGSPMIAFPILAVCMIGGTIINMVPLQLTLISSFIALSIIGYSLWLKRAT